MPSGDMPHLQPGYPSYEDYNLVLRMAERINVLEALLDAYTDEGWRELDAVKRLQDHLEAAVGSVVLPKQEP